MRSSNLSSSNHPSQASSSSSDPKDDAGSGSSRNDLARKGRPKGRGGSWVRLGVRKEANTARVMMYRHPDPVEGVTLSSLADELLERLLEVRGADVSAGRAGDHLQRQASIADLAG